MAMPLPLLLQPIIFDERLTQLLQRRDICVAGIALASNLGGMTSPISSPQNIFAIQEMGRGGNSVSWLSWFAVALPIAFIGNLVCWGALLAVYRPNRTLKEVRRLPDTTVRALLSRSCSILADSLFL